MSTVIQAKGVGKQYRIGHVRERYQTFSDKLVELVQEPLRRIRRFGHSSHREEDTIWALRNVDFDVNEGEVVGIIGRNGAGKSTLLKVLSQITDPTEGRIELRGRVASLLEVGTGFHPELSGRENIFLNGAILGMKRAEIRQKFDDIVAFAEIEEFVDTPVKRYSSGMYVRLAFAVAAHLEPEILVVDEVLSVGDAAFQKKCIGKMGNIAEGGRTVLFVSHNMAAVESLCSKTLVLETGNVLGMGPTEEMIQTYLSHSFAGSAEVDVSASTARVAGARHLVKQFRITDGSGQPLHPVPLGSEICFEIDIETEQPLSDVGIGIHIYNLLRQRVLTFHTAHQHPGRIELVGKHRLRCKVPRLDLIPGSYSIVLGVAAGKEMADRIDPVMAFDVSARDIFGTGKLPTMRDGTFVAEGRWEVE